MDGLPRNLFPETPAIGALDAAAQFNIGKPIGNGNSFIGYLDQLTFYNHVVSFGEIQEIYANEHAAVRRARNAHLPAWSTATEFTGHSLDIGALEQRPNPLPGDYNFNGVVDAADYIVWRKSLGSTNDLRADGDGNGSVDANKTMTIGEHTRQYASDRCRIVGKTP